MSDIPTSGMVSDGYHPWQMHVGYCKDLVLDRFWQIAFLLPYTATGLVGLLPVNVAPEAAQCSRLHVSLIVTFLELGSCTCAEITITGGIDKNFRLYRKYSALR